MPDDIFQGVTLMAVLASVIAAAGVGALVLIKSDRRDWPLFAFSVLLQLPMSWLLLDWVRQPVNAWLQDLPLDRAATLLLAGWAAPIVEETAKLWPLLLTLLFPDLIGRLMRENAVRVGLALGLGFGIGEIWMLAGQVAGSPDIAALPWYAYQGFLFERVPVVFVHGAMVAITLWFWVRGRWWGIFLAMLIHYLLNLPIPLAMLGLFGPDPAVQVTVSLGWVYLATIAMVVLVVYLLYGRQGITAMAGGGRTCRACGADYDAPLLGLNFIVKRYERCPHCRRGQLV